MRMTQENQSPIVIYQGADQAVEVRLDADQRTVWLSLQQIAELFDRDKSGISLDLNNIFKDGELSRKAVVAKNATTAADAMTYQVEYFNLDAIISVGYRANSNRTTRFRQWVARILSAPPIEDWTLSRPCFNAGACYP